MKRTAATFCKESSHETTIGHGQKRETFSMTSKHDKTYNTPCTVRVGRELAVTAHVQQNDVIYEWHGEWATWNDLQDSSKLKELMRKSEKLVARTSPGMKGGRASGRGSLPH